MREGLGWRCPNSSGSAISDRDQARAVVAARITCRPEETRELGARVGASLRPGDCIGLVGDLGAGKTVFVQGVTAGAGAESDVRSPTFMLHAVHPGRLTVHHLDLYRLPAPVDLRQLGLEEFLAEGAALVEWAERADPVWFDAIVRLEHLGGDRRSLSLKGSPRLGGALAGV